MKQNYMEILERQNDTISDLYSLVNFHFLHIITSTFD